MFWKQYLQCQIPLLSVALEDSEGSMHGPLYRNGFQNERFRMGLYEEGDWIYPSGDEYRSGGLAGKEV